MVEGWFGCVGSDQNRFIKALLNYDFESMNYYMNEIAYEMISVFDVGKSIITTASRENRLLKKIGIKNVKA